MSVKKYTRSAKSSIKKYTNQGKKDMLVQIHAEYIRVMQEIINIEFVKNDHQFKTYVPKQTENIISEQTWLSKRMIQAAGKQAMGILKGTSAKQNKRKHILDNMSPKDPNYTNLLNAINKNRYSKPTISKDTPMVLDSRMVSFEEDSDGDTTHSWITFGSIGNKTKLHLPVKTTSHMKKIQSKGGKMNKSISLTPNHAYFSYNFDHEPKDKSERNKTITLGIDVGINSLITASDGQKEQPCVHGHTIKSILTDMSHKKKGSKEFKRKQTQRKQHINWVINNMDLHDVNHVICELLKDMRRGKNHGRIMSSWTYTTILTKLKRKCEEENVSISFVSPTYTSRRCSNCGWTKDGNRNGEEFECNACGHSMNADLNAAINISSGIKPIKFNSRNHYDIANGFYWLCNNDCQESIVPDPTQTAKC